MEHMKKYMRGGPAPLLLTLLLLSVGFNAMAYQLPGENNSLAKYCRSKAQYAKELIQSRGSTGDRNKEVAAQLRMLREKYEKSDGYPHHAYVDMQRIVRDAYRFQGDGYRRNDPEAFAAKEYYACLRQDF